MSGRRGTVLAFAAGCLLGAAAVWACRPAAPVRGEDGGRNIRTIRELRRRIGELERRSAPAPATNAVPMSSQRNAVSGGRLSVSTDGGFLVYRPGMASTNDANAVVVVDFTAKFRVASRLDVAGLDRMPEGGAQGGLSMRRQADGTVVFAGLDFADGAYAWRDLSGLESVDASKSYHVRLVRTYGGDAAGERRPVRGDLRGGAARDRPGGPRRRALRGLQAVYDHRLVRFRKGQS